MSSRKAPHDPEKLRAILQTALRLFNTQGYDATPVPLIAKEAEVGTGTIYRYFESKEELVNSLFQHCKNQLNEALLRDFEKHRTFEDQFRHYCARTLQFALDFPAEFAFLELHNHEPYLNAPSRKVDDAIYGQVILFLEAGKRAGLLRDLPAALMLALVLGSITGAFKDPHVVLKKDQAPAIVEACWAMVRRADGSV